MYTNLTPQIIPQTDISQFYPVSAWVVNKIKDYYNYRKDLHQQEQDRLTGKTEFERQKELLQMQQEYNSAEALKNREFQLHMSNTAFQRQAEDLEKAGFNRALVLGNGGASTGSGTAASSGLGSAPQTTNSSNQYKIAEMTNLVSAVNNLANSAVSVYNQHTRNKTSISNSLINGIFGILGGSNMRAYPEYTYGY